MNALINESHYLIKTLEKIENHSKLRLESIFHEVFPKSKSALEYEKNYLLLENKLISQYTYFKNELQTLLIINYEGFLSSIDESIAFLRKTLAPLQEAKQKTRQVHLILLYPLHQLIFFYESIINELQNLKLTAQNESQYSLDDIRKLILIGDKDFLSESGILDYIEQNVWNSANEQLQNNPDLFFSKINLDHYTKDNDQPTVAQLIQLCNLCGINDFLMGKYKILDNNHAKLGQFWHTIVKSKSKVGTYEKAVNESYNNNVKNVALHGSYKKIFEELTGSNNI